MVGLPRRLLDSKAERKIEVLILAVLLYAGRPFSDDNSDDSFDDTLLSFRRILQSL